MMRYFDRAMAWLFIHVVPNPGPLMPMWLYLWFVGRAGNWAYKDYGASDHKSGEA